MEKKEEKPSEEPSTKPPIMSEPSLRLFFQVLDLSFAENLLRDRFSSRVRRPRLPIPAMVAAQLFKELRQIKSYRKLSGILEENKGEWARFFGFQMKKTKRGIRYGPSHDSFSAFRKRVGPDKYMQIFNLLRDQWKQVVEQIEAKNPKATNGSDEESFDKVGDLLAVDSTVVRAYCRPRGRKISDPEAGWGYARDPQTGKEGKVFGWKAHAVHEANKAGPIVFKVTPASRHETLEFPSLLREAKDAGFKFKAVSADAGYDSRTNNFEVIFRHKAAPIIAYNRRRAPKGSKGHRYDVYFPIPRGSKPWKKLFKKRTSIERQFSELKEQLGFKNLTLRGLKGATIHFALSFTVLIAINLVAHITGNPELLRSIEPWRYL